MNGESRLVERDVMFDGGVAFGVDKALVPLGFGGSCDEIKETHIMVNVGTFIKTSLPFPIIPYLLRVHDRKQSIVNPRYLILQDCSRY